MCFHTKQSKEAVKLEKEYNAKFLNKDIFIPSNYYNGFTFPKTPIITNENTSSIQMINWGLVPNWANSDWDKKHTLNARVETIDERPSFKYITDNRCIVIVDGFFEWQHRGSQKIKYEIGFNNELFAFAGLYDINDNYKSYTIITTEAKGIMRKIHNTKLRMPLALKTTAQIRNWLDGNDEEGAFDFTTVPLDTIQPTLF